jgi:gliding motility-associated protein GldC
MAAHNSEIKINIGLDEQRVPEHLDWTATDGGVNHAPAKAILLSVFDKKTQDTLKVDLWSKDMTTDEMKKFIHQTFMAMADTLERAADEKEVAAEMRIFGKNIGKKMKLF